MTSLYFTPSMSAYLTVAEREVGWRRAKYDALVSRNVTMRRRGARNGMPLNSGRVETLRSPTPVNGWSNRTDTSTAGRSPMFSTAMKNLPSSNTKSTMTSGRERSTPVSFPDCPATRLVAFTISGSVADLDRPRLGAIHRALLQPLARGLEQQQVIALPERVV